MNPLTSTEYKSWIGELKDRYRQAQIKAATKVNATLIEFYWELGPIGKQLVSQIPWGLTIEAEMGVSL